jgi:hypothetical protein
LANCSWKARNFFSAKTVCVLEIHGEHPDKLSSEGAQLPLGEDSFAFFEIHREPRRASNPGMKGASYEGEKLFC